jgi:threonylcarbamoyladenosine tRNA methylthiotransferase MtaB
MAEYHVENFGCRASQADGDAIAASLEQMGLSAAPTLHGAEVVVVNTCTVTAEADREARAYIRRVQRANAGVRIVVTGCYAQRAPQEVGALPGVAAVVGNSHKDQVAMIAATVNAAGNGPRRDFVPLAALSTLPSASVLAGAEGVRSVLYAHSDFPLLAAAGDAAATASWPAVGLGMGGPKAERTRPSLKVQEGCGNRCTFCVIPATRGPSRSLPRATVLRAVEGFVANGGKELVLSGINLGRWGRDLATPEHFAALVAIILEKTTLPRLRISSVEPMDWDADLIALLAQYGQGDHPRMARHAHLPLQSGSDAVLRRMHRRYRPWHYAAKLAAIRSVQPQAAIGADVMVGFPGESEDEFRESYDFIAAQPFTYLHLFPFSARPGTPAWELHREHPVSSAAVQERMAVLRRLIEQKNRAFRQSLVGQRLSVVTLETSAPLRKLRQTETISDNFVPVRLDDAVPANLLLLVQVLGSTDAGANGTAGGPPTPGRLLAHPVDLSSECRPYLPTQTTAI